MKYVLTQKNKIVAFSLIGVGIACIVYGFLSDPTRTWANLLLNNFYFMAIALAGVFFLAVQYVAEVGWSAIIKRIPMAMGSYLPYAGIIMILIFLFGQHHLYHWTDADLYDKASPHYDEILAGKRAYLNIPFYTIRLVLYAAIWAGFAFLLRRESLREDLEGGLKHYKKNIRYSAVFLVLFAITSSTSAWDILMSIEAHWFSTLFGWYVFAGMFVSGLNIMTILVIYLKKKGYLPQINENHIHDLGKFIFAFSIFWTYLWFSQFMLIWYANLPEEITYYLIRQDHYRTLFILNFVINFFFPFFILMTRGAKRKETVVIVSGVFIFIGHWIDTFLIVMPGVVGSHWHIGIPEIGIPFFFAGFFIWTILNALSKAAVIPQHHPLLEESIHHHV